MCAPFFSRRVCHEWVFQVRAVSASPECVPRVGASRVPRMRAPALRQFRRLSNSDPPNQDEVGLDDDGQCSLPEPEHGASYVQVAAGSDHTLLMRNDGRAVVVGLGTWGFQLPELEPGVSYCANRAAPDFVVQLIIEGHLGGLAATVRKLSGDVVANLTIADGAMGEQATVGNNREGMRGLRAGRRPRPPPGVRRPAVWRLLRSSRGFARSRVALALMSVRATLCLA